MENTNMFCRNLKKFTIGIILSGYLVICLLGTGCGRELPADDSVPAIDIVEKNDTAQDIVHPTDDKTLTEKISEKNDSVQETVQAEHTEELSYPYDYLDVDDPRAQEIMADGWEDGFITSIPIRGLVGYSPISNNWGGLASYHKDREVLIEKNVGKGIFQSDKLAVVKENMAEMFMDIIRNRGSNIEDYQKFFSDRGMLEQFKDFLINDIRKEWVLLESHYLSDYAGNNDSFWWDGLNSETLRYVETESFYNFKFMFYADYRAMECGEDDETSAIWIGCGISKETGLIEELATGQWSLSRNDFEIGRW